MNSLTEQSSQVLAEIDAALAICEKATAGPWQADGFNLFALESGSMIADLYEIDGAHEDDGNGDFIAAARTVCPKSLKIIRDDINAWLAITDTNCDNDGMSCRNVEIAEKRLTALIAQWNSNK